MNKFAMVTRCDENVEELTKVTHPILMDYAVQWGCDFITLDQKEEWMTDYELAHYRILRVRELLEKYERILVIDSDVVIMPSCPNPFEVVPEDKIGSIYEDKGSREALRQGVIISIQERFGDVGWEEGYINTGFFVVSRQHSNIFQKINDQLWTGFGYDDALLGYNIHKFGHEVYELPFQFNHMSMHSESWNGEASRFNSFVIHYAGLARFPDDRSGRVVTGDNNMADRIILIKNDIERIADGLMGFQSVKPTELQGAGSRCYNAKAGVQEKDIVLKVPNTPECLKREVKVLEAGIPGTVSYFGVGENDQVGKFLVLEKLYPLPTNMSREMMLKVATTTLITMRQLYKLNIPWICRQEHIMVDENMNVKLIDFGDDPYPKIPFYGKTDDEEAILMDGSCDANGLYLQRGTYPLSGYVATMKYLCDKNSLSTDIIYNAERAMITHEYQALKDVHQPIWFPSYEDILRTESEPDDKDFGKLVPPNRECEDRATMFYKAAEPWITKETTWLDIGCNVGWFCFEFSDTCKMTGMDFEGEKIGFAKMLVEGEEGDVEFLHEGVDLDYASAMSEYDIISVMSVMHLKLVKDRDMTNFWDLFRLIASKARKMMFFEFPPHSYGLAGATGGDDFNKMVKVNGGFKSVEVIGKTDAGRPMLKCLK
jgi:hypothetical protein